MKVLQPFAEKRQLLYLCSRKSMQTLKTIEI